MLGIILLVFALVCFILAAVGVPNPPRVNLVAAGLAFLTAYYLFVKVGA